MNSSLSRTTGQHVIMYKKELNWKEIHNSFEIGSFQLQVQELFVFFSVCAEMPLVIKMQERGSPSVNKIFDMQQGIRSEKYDAYVFSKVKNQPNVNSDVPSVERFKNIRMDLPSVHSIRIITAESKYRVGLKEEGNITINS